MAETIVTEKGRMIESARSQNKLLTPVESTDTGLAPDKDFIRIKIVTNDTRQKKIIILPCADGGGDNTADSFKLTDGDLYAAAGSGDFAGMKITCTSQSQISLGVFMVLLSSGALRATEGIIRCSGGSPGDAEAQAIQGQGLIGVDIKGFDEDPLNLSVIKDMSLQNDKVLGFYRYPEDTILCMSQGLTYLVSGVTDKTKPLTIVMDIYFDSYLSTGSLLKNGLKRGRLKR